MHHKVKIKREVLLGDMALLYMPDEKEGSYVNVSRYTIIVKMTKQGDENSAMGLRPAYSIDSDIEEDYYSEVGNMSFNFLCLVCFDKPVL